MKVIKINKNVFTKGRNEFNRLKIGKYKNELVG